MQTRASVMTGNGVILLRKLCRHFAHKVPTTIADTQGIIDFPFGRCLLAANEGRLDLSISLGAALDAEKAEQVVGDHLQRMSRDEDLAIQWVRAG